MKLSVITVCYNSAKTIERTIRSVVSQSFDGELEYIIIDGGSKDGTIDIIKRYSSKIAYWVSEPDKGLYDAMNKGIARASGDLVGIINSDDWYEENVFSAVAEEYKKNNDKNILICGELLFHRKTKTRKIIPEFDKLWYGMTLPHPAVWIAKSVYNKYGGFDTQYRVAADYELMVRLYHNNVPFVHIHRVISHMSAIGLSETNKGRLEGFKECFKIGLRSSFPKVRIYYAYIIKCIKGNLLNLIYKITD